MIEIQFCDHVKHSLALPNMNVYFFDRLFAFREGERFGSQFGRCLKIGIRRRPGLGRFSIRSISCIQTAIHIAVVEST